MFVNYIYKGSLFEQFQYRGSFSRIARNMKDDFRRMKQKQKLEREDKSWIPLFNCHLNKPIEVTLGFFDTELAMSLIQKTYPAILKSFDETQYCKVIIEGIDYEMTVHKSSIKLLWKNFF